MAVRNGKKVAAKFLLEQGANIEARDTSGQTALMIAGGNGFDRNTEMLLAKKAKVSATSDDGSVAPHLVARNAEDMNAQNSGDIIRMLLSEGADINSKNGKIQTPLDKAANRRDNGTIILLRSYGAVLHKPNKDVRELYASFFDPDPEATTARERGSVDRYTTKSESPTILGADSVVDKEEESVEKNGLMLKNLELGGEAGSITAEPGEVEKDGVPERHVEASPPPPSYTDDGRA